VVSVLASRWGELALLRSGGWACPNPALTASRVKEIALVHMLMTLSTVVVFAGNLWLWTQRLAETGWLTVLSAISVLLLGITGWLGGELVFRDELGVEPQDEMPRPERGRQ
jgi:uncharacterized membrane protein